MRLDDLLKTKRRLAAVERYATDNDLPNSEEVVCRLVDEGLRVVANRKRGARSLNEKLTPEQRAANARKGGLAKARARAERAQV